MLRTYTIHSIAILSTPIFSETGELVYVASAGPQFSAVILQDGQSSWSVNTELPITASPVLGENVVYTIEVSLVAIHFQPGR